MITIFYPSPCNIWSLRTINIVHSILSPMTLNTDQTYIFSVSAHDHLCIDVCFVG